MEQPCPLPGLLLRLALNAGRKRGTGQERTSRSKDQFPDYFGPGSRPLYGRTEQKRPIFKKGAVRGSSLVNGRGLRVAKKGAGSGRDCGLTGCDETRGAGNGPAGLPARLDGTCRRKQHAVKFRAPAQAAGDSEESAVKEAGRFGDLGATRGRTARRRLGLQPWLWRARLLGVHARPLFRRVPGPMPGQCAHAKFSPSV